MNEADRIESDQSELNQVKVKRVKARCSGCPEDGSTSAHVCRGFAVVGKGEKRCQVRCSCEACRHQQRLMVEFDAARRLTPGLSWEGFLATKQPARVDDRAACRTKVERGIARIIATDPEAKVKFYYWRRGGLPIVTVCLMRCRMTPHEEPRTFRAFALCHPKDAPMKAKGRAFALERACMIALSGRDAKCLRGISKDMERALTAPGLTSPAYHGIHDFLAGLPGQRQFNMAQADTMLCEAEEALLEKPKRTG